MFLVFWLIRDAGGFIKPAPERPFTHCAVWPATSFSRLRFSLTRARRATVVLPAVSPLFFGTNLSDSSTVLKR